MKKEVIKSLDGDLIVTEFQVKHSDKKLRDYLSFSNGQDVAGVFIGENTKKDLIKFLTAKKEVKSGK